MNPSCVLLAEPHHGLADGIRSLLGTMFAGVVMVAEEGSLMETVERLRPALAVIDVSLGRGDVPGLIHRLRERASGLKVIVFCMHSEATLVESILAGGADGVVLKSALRTQLFPAIEAVLRGERYVSPTSRAQEGEA